MRSARSRGVRLSVGNQIMLGADTYRIVGHDTIAGSLVLEDTDGQHQTYGIEAIVTHPHLAGPHSPSDRKAALAILMAKRDLELAEVKMAHVLEAETGFRSGYPDNALPGEPKDCFNPQHTTLTQRRLAKALELDNESAALAGIKMSYITLRRYGGALGQGDGLAAFLDFRKIRRSNGRHSIGPELEDACWGVFATLSTRSNLTKTGIANLVLQRMVAVHGGDQPDEIRALLRALPCERTIVRWFEDRFLPSELNGKARTRASATNVSASGYFHPNPTRPGELVILDTYSIDTLLKSTRFAGAVRGYLILAIDWFSRSIVSVRIVEIAETALDVAWAVREIARPKQMRPNWPDDARWPFAGVPDRLLNDLVTGVDPDEAASDAHQNVSAQPFVEAESLVLDHGSPCLAGD